MPSELPFDEIKPLTMSSPVRLNADPPEITLPGTTEAMTMFWRGPGLIADKPLFELGVESMSIINQTLPSDQHYPTGEINAMVTIQGRPVSRPVYVLNQQCERVYITHSDSQGRYRAIGLDTEEHYIVLALDKPDREYNAAISDYVQPESV